MRIAWIGPAPGSASPAGARFGALLPHLRAVAEVERFVEVGRERASDSELPVHPVSALRPREFDQVLYTLGDEPELAFALPVLRLVGGTVLLEGWELSRLARAAWPALRGDGARASWLVLREGGLADLCTWRARRGTPERCEGLALNRSVVRHGDAFVVREEELARRIRLERNAHTPVAVLADAPPEEEARRLREALERFPHARRARRPLVVAALRARR